MNTGIQAENAIEIMKTTSETLANTHIHLVQDWMPDDPPLTLVFSNMARSLKTIEETSDKVGLASIFHRLEQLMISGSEDVKAAVATGFLEAILDMISSGTLNRDAIFSVIGSESMRYCKAYSAYLGTEL
jgi:hypothetical protein